MAEITVSRMGEAAFRIEVKEGYALLPRIPDRDPQNDGKGVSDWIGEVSVLIHAVLHWVECLPEGIGKFSTIFRTLRYQFVPVPSTVWGIHIAYKLHKVCPTCRNGGLAKGWSIWLLTIA